MTRIRTTLPRSIGAGLLGGLVVSVLAWAAFALGIVAGSHSAPASQAGPGASAASSAPVSTARGPREPSGPAAIYRRDAPGVVYITARGGAGGATATGSGFVVNRAGDVITNAHVIDGAQAIDVKLGPNARPVRARVLGRDDSTDVAMLKVKAPAGRLHPLQLGDSSAARIGDSVVAIGNPFGLDRTITSGIVSAVGRSIQAPNGSPIDGAIQTDAAINPGNSGGPLINAAGQVIGITAQIETGGTSNGNVGVGFAIPIDTVRQVADGILAGTGSQAA